MNERFFNELKRRNVFRVAIACVVAVWVLLQENIQPPPPAIPPFL